MDPSTCEDNQFVKMSRFRVKVFTSNYIGVYIKIIV